MMTITSRLDRGGATLPSKRAGRWTILQIDSNYKRIEFKIRPPPRYRARLRMSAATALPKPTGYAAEPFRFFVSPLTPPQRAGTERRRPGGGFGRCKCWTIGEEHQIVRGFIVLEPNAFSQTCCCHMYRSTNSFMGLKRCITVHEGCSNQTMTPRLTASMNNITSNTTMRFERLTRGLKRSPRGIVDDLLVVERPIQPHGAQSGAPHKLPPGLMRIVNVRALAKPGSARKSSSSRWNFLSKATALDPNSNMPFVMAMSPAKSSTLSRSRVRGSRSWHQSKI